MAPPLRVGGIDRALAIHEAGHAVARILTADALGYPATDAVSFIVVHGSSSGNTTSADGRMLLSSQATTYGPMLSAELTAFVKREGNDDGTAFASMSAEARKVLFEKARNEGLDIDAWYRVKVLECAFGPAAEARFEKRPVSQVWNAYACEDDRDATERYGAMAGWDRGRIAQEVEQALLRAEKMMANGDVWRSVVAIADKLPAVGKLKGKKVASIVARKMRRPYARYLDLPSM